MCLYANRGYKCDWYVHGTIKTPPKHTSHPRTCTNMLCQAVLSATAATCDEATLSAEKPSSDVCNKRELRLVQNQAAIANPVVSVRCCTWKEFQPAHAG